MKKFKSAVVGTGFIGPVHVEALQRAGVHVKGIVGSSPEKSKISATQLGLEKAYQSFDEVIQDAEIDCVHLATPNRLHYPQVKAVLAAEKHVMCEKPLALSASESAELVQLADQSGLVAGVAHNIRFYPLCHESAARIRNQSCGEVLHVNGSYVQDWLLKDTDFNWRVLDEEGGELRAVADIGTHWLDLIQYITNLEVTSVCADLRTVHPVRKKPIADIKTFSGGADSSGGVEDVAISTEDCGSIMLRFSNGANGCLWVSQATAGRKNCLRFEIGGSRQAISWNSESPNELWLGNRDRPNELLLRDPSLMSDASAAISNYPGGHNEGFPDTFKQLFVSFYDYIAAEDVTTPAPFPTFADGHREIVLCESILQSHRERRWVDVTIGEN